MTAPKRIAVSCAALLLAACTSAITPPAPTVTPGATTVATAVPSEQVATSATSNADAPTLEGSFSVADDGRELALRCWGEGRPTVLFDGGCCGGDGTLNTVSLSFIRRVAAATRICVYDRAGTGQSDPAPEGRPRTADDVIADLHALIAAAALDGPLVLVGGSFGGMIVTYYAARHPEQVAGVVLLDVPAPSATLTLEEAPEIAWDDPRNPEHLDVIPGFENRFANERNAFDAPLLVITATSGQSNVEDQSFWLDLSKDARQIEIVGGHGLDHDNPEEAADLILDVVQAVGT
jgi:pimeloyl-ACP methyl ester carboxylesterase